VSKAEEVRGPPSRAHMMFRRRPLISLTTHTHNSAKRKTASALLPRGKCVRVDGICVSIYVYVQWVLTFCATTGSNGFTVTRDDDCI
jgi:hypothetical protein